jgi:hypothetical protein
MSKPLVLLSALVTAGILAVTGAIYLGPDQDAVNARFGQGHAASQIFLPAKPRTEKRIIRHPQEDGSAVDDVEMRDGTTKRIVYDSKMTLRQVFAYFKAPANQEQGPLMYEKTHDRGGHLFAERHLRLDGSLEMDGCFNPDATYVRHLYYPGASHDPHNLVVSAEQTFDKWWHPVAETDFRPDSTKKLVHTWGDGLDETLSNFADDGKTLVSRVTTGRGKYYSAIFYPDGVNIKVEALNTYEGTTFQWYRLDHSLKLKLTLTPSNADEIIIPTDAGKPMIKQVWYRNMSEPLVDGQFPQRLEHIDHYNDAGKVDVKYEFDSTSHQLSVVTVYRDDKPWGARAIYTIGEGGLATNVKTFDAENKDDGGKPLTAADGKRFVLESWMVTHPSYELPPMKDGLTLYGQQYFGVF